MNLILSINQVVLLALIFSKDKGLPRQVCYISLGIQGMANHGVSIFQLAISYSRYRTSKDPVSWERNHKNAWVISAIIWTVAIMLAIFETLLNIGSINGTLNTCFWPMITTKAILKFSVRVISLAALMALVITTCCYYRKSLKLLHENQKLIEYELDISSTIDIRGSGGDGDGIQKKRQPQEKATLSLVALFMVHTITLAIPQLYNTMRSLIVGINWLKTGKYDDASPTLLLNCLSIIGFFTTISPIVLILVSKRFRENAKSILRCKWNENACQEDIPVKAYVQRRRSSSLQRKATPESLDIFIGESCTANCEEKYLVRKKSKEKKETTLTLDLPEERKKNEALSRIGQAAIDDGLVLSAAGREDITEEFFIDEERERQYQEALASAKALDELFIL